MGSLKSSPARTAKLVRGLAWLRSPAGAEVAVPLALALFVLATVFGRGLPELRHDWRWPGEDGVASLLSSWTSGWLPYGIGEGNPYPTFYLAGWALRPLASVLTPLSIAGGVVATSVFIIARSAMRLAASFGGGFLGSLATATIAVLNPWVYSKEVAGHVFMIADYGIVLALAAEARRPAPRRSALATLCCFLVMQIQFALIVAVPLAVWLMRKKHVVALSFAIAAAVPIALGLAFESDALAQIPYSLVWQRAQSVPPELGVVLQGYFTYADVFRADAVGTCALVAAAIAGAFAARSSPPARLLTGATVLLLLVSAGTTGPLAVPYAWVVTHARASGVFRELYDLIGLVAAAYVAGVASTCRWQIAALPILAIGLSFAAVWVLAPPSRWFVSAADIRFTAVSAPQNERVAFFPAFQPLSLGNRGSGYDPDLYVRPGRGAPLNEFYPTFPVDAALTRAERSGQVDPLGWYGVSEIAVRPQYRSDHRSLSFQRDRPLVAASAIEMPLGRRVRYTLPLLSFAPGAPETATIGGGLDERSVSAIDAGAIAPISYEPSSETLDPALAWVDLRLAVADLPEAENAIGGVVTDGTVPLDVRGAGALLLFVERGSLRAGAASRGPTSALTWWALPPGTTSVRCAGVCAVAAGATTLPAGRAHVPSPPSIGVPLRSLTPWLAIADLPPLAMGTLRFNVRYDAAWAAISGSERIDHVRLDTSVNGFVVPRSAVARRVVIVERAAAAMFVAELALTLTLAAFVFDAALRALRGHARARREGAAAACEGTSGS